jgi:hypothetical protein
MTKPELVELNASEMEAISAGFQGSASRRPRLGALVVLLLLALLLRSRIAAPAAEAAAV